MNCLRAQWVKVEPLRVCVSNQPRVMWVLRVHSGTTWSKEKSLWLLLFTQILPVRSYLRLHSNLIRQDEENSYLPFLFTTVNKSEIFPSFHCSIKSIVYSFCTKQKHFCLLKKKSSLLRIWLAWQELLSPCYFLKTYDSVFSFSDLLVFLNSLTL